jgi:folate-binding protein YgfZ
MSSGTGGATAEAGGDLPAQYRAGRTAAILAGRPDITRLLIRGRDALDLLHRLSTNDLKGIREGEGRATVFTTNKGRILDLVTLHRLPRGLLAHCGEGRSGLLREWIERFTFREEVCVEDWTASHATMGLYGPLSGNVAGALWGPAAALPPHHVAEVPAGGARAPTGDARALVVRSFPIGGDGYLITAPVEAVDSLRLGLLRVEGTRPLEAGRECVEVLRIEAGLPAAGRELTEEYNPWEARLQDAISLDKGCYVGQEVIARLYTYRKVSRQLVRLRARGSAGAPAAGVVAPGSLIRIAGETSGAVTSSAPVPGETDEVVALGYVRDKDAAPDRPAEVVRAGRSLPATIEGAAR